jgi:lauroyl/myristoyl acyltransferase
VLPPVERPDETAPDAVKAYTQRLAEKFEELIRSTPDQWHVFNRYWID